MVGTRQGTEARVKIIVDDFGVTNIDVVREFGIDPQHPAALCPLCLCIEVRDLAERMDTGVGAARTQYLCRLIRHQGDGLFDTFLYPKAGLLPLPANVATAIVFNAECDTHGSNWLWTAGL